MADRKKKPPSSRARNLHPQNNELNALRAGYSRLAQALELNTRLFTDAFQMADAQIHVMQRALNDQILNKALVKEDGGIDFPTYLMEYWTCLGFAEFVEQLKQFAQKRELSEGTRAPSEEGVHIFGGA